jgi:membrane-anchored protein YejM (alkaline phosphatase superfamily)
VHYVDGLAAGVIEDLRRRGLADNTVVIVTSDHGEEFQESGPEFAIHGSGFSRYQLQVPMLVAWPGDAPGRIARRTSHYDVAPTLLRRLFGCAVDPAMVSIGHDLYEGPAWDWLLAGSYFNYAVVEPEQITITYPNGLFEVRDSAYQVLEQASFHVDVVQAVMEANRRFRR